MSKPNRTIDRIIHPVNCTYGAPMGRMDTGSRPEGVRLYDCLVPMEGAYDKGGAYWGLGRPLRVAYTKDLSYIHFYRLGE